MPVRAIWGRRISTAWPSVEARYDVLREGHPELVTAPSPDAGHWVMYEQPAAYNAALIEMLEIPAARAAEMACCSRTRREQRCQRVGDAG